MSAAPELVIPSVRAACNADRAAWNDFVLDHPDGTFFHRHEWADVLSRAFGHRAHFLAAEAHGKLVGILPLAELRSRLFGHALISTPFCVYGGIVAANQAAHAALERAACELARQLGVAYLEMRNRSRRHPAWPAKDLYCTFRRPIAPVAEQNMLAIPRKQRAMVRKGIQRQLGVRIDRDTRDLYDLYARSLRNLGTPVFARSYLDLLCEIFASDAEVMTVTHDGRPVSSVLSFRFRNEILPYYGGGSEAARNVAAHDFMYWQVMERARSEGLAIFDFGRSKQGTGSFDFKCHWGFEPQPLYYEYFLVNARAMPNLSPTNPRYQRAISLWQRLPLPLANVMGPPIAKYLG